MRSIIYWSMQGSWGVLQNLLGLSLFLYQRWKHPEYKVTHFRNACVLHWSRRDSVAIGRFIFFGHQGEHEDRMLRHEYGHTIQSAVLGPLYLFLIGLPSYIWANQKTVANQWKCGNCSYFDFYTERWADAWGGVTKAEAAERIL